MFVFLHSRILDPKTEQVNVTSCPGHVNRLPFFEEVSCTFSTVRKLYVEEEGGRNDECNHATLGAYTPGQEFLLLLCNCF